MTFTCLQIWPTVGRQITSEIILSVLVVSGSEIRMCRHFDNLMMISLIFPLIVLIREERQWVRQLTVQVPGCRAFIYVSSPVYTHRHTACFKLKRNDLRSPGRVA